MENKYQKTSYEMVRIGRREIITQLSQPAHAESLFRLYPSSDSLPFLQNLIDRNWGRFSKPNLMILSWTDRESRESQKGRWLEREGETSREREGKMFSGERRVCLVCDLVEIRGVWISAFIDWCMPATPGPDTR